MHGSAVRLGVDGHRSDAEVPAGTRHPDGDLAPVGDQDLCNGSAQHFGAVCQAGLCPWIHRRSSARRSRAHRSNACPSVLSHDQLARLARSRFAQVVQLAETTSTNSVLVATPKTGLPRAWSSSPTTRPPAADASTAGGSPRRGSRSCSRCFFAPAAKNCRQRVATSLSRRCPWRWSKRRGILPGSRSSSSGRTISSSATAGRRREGRRRPGRSNL